MVTPAVTCETERDCQSQPDDRDEEQPPRERDRGVVTLPTTQCTCDTIGVCSSILIPVRPVVFTGRERGTEEPALTTGETSITTDEGPSTKNKHTHTHTHTPSHTHTHSHTHSHTHTHTHTLTHTHTHTYVVPCLLCVSPTGW